MAQSTPVRAHSHAAEAPRLERLGDARERNYVVPHSDIAEALRDARCGHVLEVRAARVQRSRVVGRGRDALDDGAEAAEHGEAVGREGALAHAHVGEGVRAHALRERVKRHVAAAHDVQRAHALQQRDARVRDLRLPAEDELARVLEVREARVREPRRRVLRHPLLPLLLLLLLALRVRIARGEVDDVDAAEEREGRVVHVRARGEVRGPREGEGGAPQREAARHARGVRPGEGAHRLVQLAVHERERARLARREEGEQPRARRVRGREHGDDGDGGVRVADERRGGGRRHPGEERVHTHTTPPLEMSGRPPSYVPVRPATCVCGAPALHRCSRCLGLAELGVGGGWSGVYCSAACQRADWPAHKGPCKAASPIRQLCFTLRHQGTRDVYEHSLEPLRNGCVRFCWLLLLAAAAHHRAACAWCFVAPSPLCASQRTPLPE